MSTKQQQQREERIKDAVLAFLEYLDCRRARAEAGKVADVPLQQRYIMEGEGHLNDFAEYVSEILEDCGGV